MNNTPKVTKEMPFVCLRDMPSFLKSCSEVLEELSVGESMRVQGFSDEDALKQFAEQVDLTQNQDKNYVSQTDEKDLTYIVKRVP